MMKNIIIALSALIIVGGTIYYIMQSSSMVKVGNTLTDSTNEKKEEVKSTPKKTIEIKKEESEVKTQEVIGLSVEKNDITAYHYGNGQTEVMFVGGIHGAYSWNTTLVAYKLMDFLKENPIVIPDNVKVTVIPVLNPDGLKSVVGSTDNFIPAEVSTSDIARIAGRFNGNTVDLNRNFDCEWNTSGTWQNKTVSGGDKPFSEPEAKAMRDYVNKNNPAGVVVWYSAAGGVYSSNCKNGVLPETSELTKLFAQASGYPAHEEFNYYEVTGDMVNWLAKEKIPAISVLLTDRNNTEWNKNKAGVEAVLNHYKK